MNVLDACYESNNMCGVGDLSARRWRWRWMCVCVCVGDCSVYTTDERLLLLVAHIEVGSNVMTTQTEGKNERAMHGEMDEKKKCFGWTRTACRRNGQWILRSRRVSVQWEGHPRWAMSEQRSQSLATHTKSKSITFSCRRIYWFRFSGGKWIYLYLYRTLTDSRLLLPPHVRIGALLRASHPHWWRVNATCERIIQYLLQWSGIG